MSDTVKYCPLQTVTRVDAQTTLGVECGDWCMWHHVDSYQNVHCKHGASLSEIAERAWEISTILSDIKCALTVKIT